MRIKLYARIQSIIQVLFLASTNQTRIVNLNLQCNTSLCLCTFKCNKWFMSLLPLFVCSSLKGFLFLFSPYLCFSPPFWLYLCFSPPLSSMTTKVQFLVRIKSINLRVKLWFNLDHLPRMCNSVWSKGKLFQTSWSIRVVLTMLNYTSWAHILDSTLGLQAHKHVICYH